MTNSVSAQVEDLDPIKAQSWLNVMPTNRLAKKQKVNNYVRDIVAGKWQITGEAIKFDTNGNMIDGQHRCLAVIKAGVTIQVMVVRGLAPEAQSVMDTGAIRTSADQLHMMKVTNSTVVASVLNLFENYQHGNIKDTSDAAPAFLTHAEVLASLDANPDVIESAKVAMRVFKSLPLPPRVVGAAWMITQRIDKGDSDEFFRRLVELESYGSGDPVAALIRRSNGDKINRVLLPASAHLHMLLRTWNAVRRNEQLFKLTWTGYGNNPALLVKPV